MKQKDQTRVLTHLNGLLFFYGVLEEDELVRHIRKVIKVDVNSLILATLVEETFENEDNRYFTEQDDEWHFHEDLRSIDWVLQQQHQQQDLYRLPFRPVTEKESAQVVGEPKGFLVTEADRRFYRLLSDLLAEEEGDGMDPDLPKGHYVFFRELLNNGIPLPKLLDIFEEEYRLTPMEWSLYESTLLDWTANTPLWALMGWTLTEACSTTGLTADELLRTDGSISYPENPGFNDDLFSRPEGMTREEMLGHLPDEVIDDVFNRILDEKGKKNFIMKSIPNFDYVPDPEDEEEPFEEPFHPPEDDSAIIGPFTKIFVADPLKKTADNSPGESSAIGRNDPCPCGSGKKYKKCCNSPEATAASRPVSDDDHLAPAKRIPPTLDEWRLLYDAAEALREASPWKWMSDIDVFGVVDPVTRETLWCCVLGNAGSAFGLNVYPGVRGLKGLDHIRQFGDFTDSGDLLHLQDCYMTAFENRHQLADEDLQVINDLGKNYSGRNQWPMFRRFEPGYHPWHITGEESRQMVLTIEQTLVVADSFRKDPDLLESDRLRRFLVRKPVTQKGDVHWENHYEDVDLNPFSTVTPYELTNDLRLRKLLKFKNENNIPTSALEADCFYAYGAVHDKKQERPYFPRTVMILDHFDGKILSTHLLERHKNNLWQFAESLLQVMEEHRRIPTIICTDNPVVYELLEKVCAQLDIDLRLTRFLPQLLEARRSLLSHMSRM